MYHWTSATILSATTVKSLQSLPATAITSVMTFHPFPRLPFELQVAAWNFVALDHADDRQWWHRDKREIYDKYRPSYSRQHELLSTMCVSAWELHTMPVSSNRWLWHDRNYVPHNLKASQDAVSLLGGLSRLRFGQDQETGTE